MLRVGQKLKQYLLNKWMKTEELFRDTEDLPTRAKILSS